MLRTYCMFFFLFAERSSYFGSWHLGLSTFLISYFVKDIYHFPNELISLFFHLGFINLYISISSLSARLIGWRNVCVTSNCLKLNSKFSWYTRLTCQDYPERSMTCQARHTELSPPYSCELMRYRLSMALIICVGSPWHGEGGLFKVRRMIPYCDQKVLMVESHSLLVEAWACAAAGYQVWIIP